MSNASINDVAKVASGDFSLLLGAGASAALKLPTMSNFLNDAYGEDFVADIENCPAYKIGSSDVNQIGVNRKAVLKRLFHTVALIKGRMSYDLEDIFQFIHETRLLYGNKEWVNSFLYMFKVCSEGLDWSFTDYKNNAARQRNQISSWLADFSDTITQLREIMYDRFLIRPSHAEILEKAKKCNRILAEIFPDGRGTVFTTNFDTVFEAMQHKGVLGTNLDWNLSDGFSNQRNPPFSFDNFLLPQGRNLLYFKLHGSVTWERTQDESIYDSFPNVPNKVALLEPVISKSPTGFPFTQMYQIFETVLRNNKICVAIGFSFRDDAIRKLMTERLESSIPFHLIMMAPDDTSAPEASRFLEELEKFRNVTRIKEYFGSEEAFAALSREVHQHRVLLPL